MIPLGIYVFGCIGINLCYHRLLTHKGFIVPKWFERGLAMLAISFGALLAVNGLQLFLAGRGRR